MQYNTRITIEKPDAAQTRDASGHVDLSSSDGYLVHCQRWARMMPRASREFYAAQQAHADVTHVLRLHHDPQTKRITADMRISLDGQTDAAGHTRKLELLGLPVDLDARGREIELRAREAG